MRHSERGGRQNTSEDATLRLLPTLGLGFSDFGYRIFVSVVSCMDSKHGFGAA